MCVCVYIHIYICILYSTLKNRIYSKCTVLVGWLINCLSLCPFLTLFPGMQFKAIVFVDT